MPQQGVAYSWRSSESISADCFGAKAIAHLFHGNHGRENEQNDQGCLFVMKQFHRDIELDSKSACTDKSQGHGCTHGLLQGAQCIAGEGRHRARQYGRLGKWFGKFVTGFEWTPTTEELSGCFPGGNGVPLQLVQSRARPNRSAFEGCHSPCLELEQSQLVSQGPDLRISGSIGEMVLQTPLQPAEFKVQLPDSIRVMIVGCGRRPDFCMNLIELRQGRFETDSVETILGLSKTEIVAHPEFRKAMPRKNLRRPPDCLSVDTALQGDGSGLLPASQGRSLWAKSTT